jgi:hypothetical protein
MIDNPAQFRASAEFTQTICSRLATARGIHAETAISVASRMAGTMLLRSTGLPVAQFSPGTPVFSDVIDEVGEKLLGTVGETLTTLEVPLDPSKLDYDTPEENAPHMDLAETQSAFDPAFRAIVSKYRLSQEEGAQAAAVSAAMLIQKCSPFLDPHVSYTLAAYGIIEACKTVPWVS